tara:strand:- start:590 stop:1003 length:414 start_codon:yes stop_codon:yes gene_type:complete
MSVETTDLEQIWQIKQLHAQLGAAIAQINQVSNKIALVQLAQEQAELGADVDSKLAEMDVEALRTELVMYLQSVRRRSAKYLRAMKDIAGRFGKKAPVVEVVAEVFGDPEAKRGKASAVSLEVETEDDNAVIHTLRS